MLSKYAIGDSVLISNYVDDSLLPEKASIVSIWTNASNEFIYLLKVADGENYVVTEYQLEPLKIDLAELLSI